MISDKQNRFYWSLWNKCKGSATASVATSGASPEEQNLRRHELHVRAIGHDKSHYDLTNREFDLIIAEMRAIIDPSDLRSQLRQQDQRRVRMFRGIRSMMYKLGKDYPYVHGIVRRMNANGELASSELDVLDIDDLRKVMIALRKHQQRGSGTVKAPDRIYELQPV